MKMAANVESMFYVRKAPWHGLGTRVEEAPSSEEALALAGLDWNVIQKPIMTEDSLPIPGFKANIRDLDNQVLLPMNYWEKALPMKLPAPYKMAGVHGFWQSFLSGILFPVMKLHRILFL